MYSIEGIELTEIEQQFVQECNRFKETALALPNLSTLLREVFETAVLKPYSINDNRMSLYLAIFEEEEQRLLPGESAIPSLTLEDLKPLLDQIDSEISPNHRVNYFGTTEICGFFSNEKGIMATFKDFPHLALNVFMDRTGSTVTGLEMVTKLSAEEILTGTFNRKGYFA